MFHDGTLSLLTRSLSALADSFILFLPFIFLRRQWMFITCLWFVILSALELSNILYLRNFDDLIPSSSYLIASNFNSFVLDSALHTLHLPDIVFLISPIIVTIVTVKFQSSVKPSSLNIISYIALAFIFIALQFYASVRRLSIYNDVSKRQAIEGYCEGFRIQTSWEFYALNYGVPGYFIRSCLDNSIYRRRVSADDINKLIDFWQTPRKTYPLAVSFNSILAKNTDKNLILIIVESLNSKVFDFDDSKKIAPFLESLSEDSTVLFFPNITPQTGHGRSSDGQFIYNTGLLPIRGEPLVNRNANQSFPSLAKILNLNSSIEFIGENKSLWNHALTSKSYGYTELIDNIVPKGTPKAVQDSMIFAAVAERIPQLKQPFFVEITTLGMHKPYAAETGIDLKLTSTFDDLDLHYLETVYAFDSALSSFIAYLKEAGVYDNSIIVIVADHEEGPPELSELFNEKRIPALILNSNLSRQANSQETFSQIDIFPTIIDILGRGKLSDSQTYTGLGQSMIRKRDHTLPSLDSIWTISEKTIITVR